MAAKKKVSSPEPKSKKKKEATATVSSRASSVDGPEIVDGFLHFSEKDLLRYELCQHKVVNALQGIGLKKREMEQYKIDVEQRLKLFQVEVADLAAHAKVQEQELLSLQQELQREYNLDLSKVTYDERTGKVMLLGEPVPK